MATGIKRVLPDRIVFTYQGDGDLASIGMGEIIHAAARGENITVIFINNANYGMTGGQMAPTTLPGQKTTSSPNGRDVEMQGYPIRMAEMLATLDGAGYVVRRSLHDPTNIRKAKKAIRTAFETQVRGLGFSMVELLSTCPTNWNLTPVESLKWLEEHMLPYYPLGDYKIAPSDHSAAQDLVGALREVAHGDHMQTEIILSGFGGQGIMFAGQILSYAAMDAGKEVTWIPSYGPEMRGGTANCTVVIADEEIGSPVVKNPDAALAMNLPSLDKYEPMVKPGGVLVINASMVDRPARRTDITTVAIPCNEIAEETRQSRAWRTWSRSARCWPA